MQEGSSFLRRRQLLAVTASDAYVLAVSCNNLINIGRNPQLVNDGTFSITSTVCRALLDLARIFLLLRVRVQWYTWLNELRLKRYIGSMAVPSADDGRLGASVCRLCDIPLNNADGVIVTTCGHLHHTACLAQRPSTSNSASLQLILTSCLWRLTI